MRLISRPLVVPFLLFVSILIGALLLLDIVASLSVAQRLGIILLPYYLLGFVLSLSLLLNRSCEAGVSLALLIIYFYIQTELQLPLEEVRPASVYFLLSLLIPVGFMIMAVIPSQHAREFWGMTSLIISPIFAIIGIRVLNASLSNDFDRLKLVEAGESGGLGDIWLPKIDALMILPNETFYLFVFAMCFCIFVFLLSRTLSRLVLFFCLLFCFITLNLLYMSLVSTLMMVASGLCLLFSLSTSVFKMLYQDELTGISNRKALNRAMASVGAGDILVMADIDQFKKLNDSYGHDTGDEVLKLVASILIKTKQNARVFRYGGEEFSLIFKKPNSEKVVEALNASKQAIADYVFVLRKFRKGGNSASKGKNKTTVTTNRLGKINTSISMGAVTLLKGESPSDALIRADEQLYKAKNSGRNKVCFSLGEP